MHLCLPIARRWSWQDTHTGSTDCEKHHCDTHAEEPWTDSETSQCFRFYLFRKALIWPMFIVIFQLL